MEQLVGVIGRGNPRYVGATMDRGDTALSETYPVEDQYVDGFGRIEKTGSNFRLVLTLDRQRDDDVDREIAARIVMPRETALSLIMALLNTKLIEFADITDLFAKVSSSRVVEHVLQ